MIKEDRRPRGSMAMLGESLGNMVNLCEKLYLKIGEMGGAWVLRRWWIWLTGQRIDGQLIPTSLYLTLPHSTKLYLTSPLQYTLSGKYLTLPQILNTRCIGWAHKACSRCILYSVWKVLVHIGNCTGTIMPDEIVLPPPHVKTCKNGLSSAL